jgi:hypothetical protein
MTKFELIKVTVTFRIDFLLKIKIKIYKYFKFLSVYIFIFLLLFNLQQLLKLKKMKYFFQIFQYVKNALKMHI